MPNKPWFRKDYENLVEAMEYLYGFRKYMYKSFKDKNNDKIIGFLSDYEKTNLYKFVFESNNIEHEGLNENNTEKLVLGIWNVWDDFIKACPADIIKMGYSMSGFSTKYSHEFDQDVWQQIEDNFLSKSTEEIIKDIKMPEQFIYENKLKDSQIAINQFLALVYAKSITYSNIAKILDNNKSFNNKARGYVSELLGKIGLKKLSKKIFSNFILSEPIINEDQIKRIHKLLAHKTKNNNNGLPGEYRPEPACIGIDVTFMEPSLIENSMKNLVQKFDYRNSSPLFIPFLEGCRFSEELIKIHPFGDFNGRLSRIILSLSLMRAGYPFWIIARSETKSKSKYMTSMKKSYGGDSSYYISLVSEMFISQIKEINNKLLIAGLPTIKKENLRPRTKEEIRVQLERFKSMNHSMK